MLKGKQSDRKLIEKLGGTSKVAKMIQSSPQRVHNWKIRGIPASIKLKHPDIFLKNK